MIAKLSKAIKKDPSLIIKIAEVCGLNSSVAVNNWIYRGSVPEKHTQKIEGLLKAIQEKRSKA